MLCLWHLLAMEGLGAVEMTVDGYCQFGSWWRRGKTSIRELTGFNPWKKRRLSVLWKEKWNLCNRSGCAYFPVSTLEFCVYLWAVELGTKKVQMGDMGAVLSSIGIEWPGWVSPPTKGQIDWVMQVGSEFLERLWLDSDNKHSWIGNSFDC